MFVDGRTCSRSRFRLRFRFTMFFTYVMLRHAKPPRSEFPTLMDEDSPARWIFRRSGPEDARE